MAYKSNGALLAHARVTTTTATTIVVRVSVADSSELGAATSATIHYTEYNLGAATSPATGQAVTPAAAVNESAGSYQDFTVTRPTAGAGTGAILFVAQALNRESVELTVLIPASDIVYAQCAATITAVSATQVTITVTGSILGGTATVGYVGVIGATLASGHAAGTYTYTQNGTDNVWVFDRPAFGTGVGQVQMRAVGTGAQSDDDFVDIPEVGRDTIALSMRARVTATAATTVTVRVALADPYPQGAASGTITYQDYGTGGVAPASGGTVTPAATLTEAAGTYIDYTITRPAFAAGTGRVTFTGAAASRGSDADAVDIPAQEKTAFGPELVVSVAPTATQYVITYSGTGTVDLSIDGAAYGAPSASPITVARNAVGGADKSYAFRATNDSRATTNTITVPAQLPDTQDALPDGSTYARTKASELSSGQVAQARDTIDSATLTIHAVRREAMARAMLFGS